MRKVGLLLMIFITVGFTYGCLGNGETQTSSIPTLTTTNQSNSTSMAQSSPPLSTATSTQPLATTAHQFKKPSRAELIENLRSIKQFTYQENVSESFNVTMKMGNFTRSGKSSIVYQKSGYVDLKGRVAEINTTVTTFPGGSSVFTREIIIGSDVYIFMGGNWIKLRNGSAVVSNMTWKYNILNFTLRYLKKNPYKEGFENGTYVLYYRITAQDLREIAMGMLGNNANVSFNVSDGILELKFIGDRLVSGRAGYRVSEHIWGEEMGRRIDVYETGNVYDEFAITSINVKERVKVPESYRA